MGNKAFLVLVCLNIIINLLSTWKSSPQRFLLCLDFFVITGSLDLWAIHFGIFNFIWGSGVLLCSSRKNGTCFLILAEIEKVCFVGNYYTKSEFWRLKSISSFNVSILGIDASLSILISLTKYIDQPSFIFIVISLWVYRYLTTV